MSASIAHILSQLPCWTSDAVLLERYIHQGDEAAFIVLARKASSLRHPDALAGWLHGEALELAGTKGAREVLERRAAGAEGARLTEAAKAALHCLARTASSLVH